MHILLATLLKERKGRSKGGRRKESRAGGRQREMHCRIVYLLRLTFLGVSGFNPGVPGVAAPAVY